MTGVFMFVLGVSKSMFSYSNWFFSGCETLFIGIISAAASFLIGLAFEGIVTD
jgi:VIT1/CCC1 family predicted Fe2+/Mn2+ transporter